MFSLLREMAGKQTARLLRGRAVIWTLLDTRLFLHSLSQITLSILSDIRVSYRITLRRS